MRQGEVTRDKMPAIQAGNNRASATCVIYVLKGAIDVPSDVFQRLEEWAAWARPRLNIDSRRHCASAEWRYESEYPDAARGGHIIQPDLHAVLDVERVVTTRLPPVNRDMVRCYFVLRHNPRETARALRIHVHRFGDELRRSILMVRNRLTKI